MASSGDGETMETGGDMEGSEQNPAASHNPTSPGTANSKPVETTDNKDIKKQEEEKAKPFIGLIHNERSLVAAVAKRKIDLLISLLEELKLAKQSETAAETSTETDSTEHSETQSSPAATASKHGDNTTNKENENPNINGKTADKPTDTSKARGDTNKTDNDIPDYVQFPKLSPKAEISHALMMAITTKQPDMIDRLLTDGGAFGVDMHIVDTWCPLICTAAELGDVETFKVMVKHCKNLAVSGNYGNILHSAVRSGIYEMVELALKIKDVDVTHRSIVQGSCALLEAVRCVRMTAAIPSEQSTTENTGHVVDGEGDGKVATAADANKASCKPTKIEYDLRIIKALIEKGCEVDVTDNTNKSCLHFASLLGYKSVVEYLIRIGADVHSTDSSNRSPFMYALFFNHSHLYTTLCCKQENINKSISDAMTILHFAATECGPQAVEFLLAQGADAFKKNSEGKVPLITAIVARNTLTVRVLAKLNPNTFAEADNDGRCALHYAMNAYRGASIAGELATILLENGADINIPDRTGKTVLLRHIDATSEQLEWMLERGANPDYVSPGGLYPILAVCELRDDNATEALNMLLKFHVNMITSQRTCSSIECLNNDEHKDLTPLQIAILDQNYELAMLLLCADVCLNQVHDWLTVEINQGNLTDDEKWAPLYAYMREKSHEPMGLKGIVRLAILKKFGPKDVKQKAKVVGLPEILQNYLEWQNYISDRQCYIDLFIKDYNQALLETAQNQERLARIVKTTLVL